jgi:CTP-dependent riboflavin kinase
MNPALALGETWMRDSAVILTGIVHTGRREAAGFLVVPWVVAQLRERVGILPYPGTLNLVLTEEASLAAWRGVRQRGGWIRLVSPDPSFCDASCFRVLVNGGVEAVIVLPHVERYPDDLVEVVAEVGLRERLGLSDGDRCRLQLGGAELVRGDQSRPV